VQNAQTDELLIKGGKWKQSKGLGGIRYMFVPKPYGLNLALQGIGVPDPEYLSDRRMSGNP
jgi:hypothetical protein